MRSRSLCVVLSLLTVVALLNASALPIPASARAATSLSAISIPFQNIQPMQDDDEDPCPDPKSKVSVTSRKAPTKEQYLALVAEISKDYAAKLKTAVKMD